MATFVYKAGEGQPGEKLAPGVTRIRGNLCNVHGRFGPCDGAGDRRPSAPGFAPKKPTGKPKVSPAERQAKREAERAAKRDATLSAAGVDPADQAALVAARAGQPLSAADGERLERLGLAEQAADGSFRLSAAGRTVVNAAARGDAGQVQDSLSAARDTVAKRQESEAKRIARDQAKREREAKRIAKQQEPKGKKGGGGGKATPAKPSAEDTRTAREAERAAERQAKTDQALRETGTSAAQLDMLRAAAEGRSITGGRETETLTRLGLLTTGPTGSMEATDQGRRALAALERGDVRGYQAALQDARARQAREAEQAKRQAEADQRRAEADRRRAEADQRRAEREARQRERSVNRPPRIVTKAFTVYKDASGALRWIARSSTAFRDREGEIVSVAALEADSVRMMRTKQFGPLRYWHAGFPDPTNVEAPWGPGIDLGPCDYSIVIGRTCVESGTFYNEAIGEAIKAAQDDYEVSKGFHYPEAARSADGVFTDIRSFERSLVPLAYGRASNLFTGIVVKEFHMDTQAEEFRKRVKAFVADMNQKGVTAEAVAQALVGLEVAEKAADSKGVAFKGLPVYTAPDGTQGIIQDGLFVALKAPMAPGEMMAAGETELVDGEAELAGESVAAGEDMLVADMTANDLREMIRSVIQESSGVIAELDGKLAAMGYQRREKEAVVDKTLTTQQQQVAALQQQVATVAAALKELLGEPTPTPSRGAYRPSQDPAATVPAAMAAQLKEQTTQAATATVSTGDPQTDQIAQWLSGGIAAGDTNHPLARLFRN